MKSVAALLIGSVAANRYNYSYDSFEKSYATQFKRLNVEYIVDELSWRNEERVRAIRDATESAVAEAKIAARDEIDARVDAFEEEIAGLKAAWADALAAKRAALDDANAHIIDTQHMLIDQAKIDVSALNFDQETLIADILDADVYHDHTTIVYHLQQADRLSALTWETYPSAPKHPYEAYQNWKDHGAYGHHDQVHATHVTAAPHYQDYDYGDAYESHYY